MTTYIDPNTDLPQNLGEIYSDRNIRIVGQARINPLNPNQVDTLDLQVLCTPSGGGAEGVANIPNGTYTLSGVGSSLWVQVQRSGTATVTPEIYAAGAQPKSRRDYVQVFYQSASNQIVSISSFLIYEGPLYTRLGYGVGQRTYDAIVGNSGDDHVTHSDLQTAINDVADNSCILVKKMCSVSTTINTNNKTIKIVFSGSGSGLQASGSPGTGITFQAAGCQLVGFGSISGFTTGVDLNNQTDSRIEMVFSGNTTNINFGSLNGTQYSVNGSYGLTESSHIETSVLEGVLGRWNNTSKRWEPISNVGGKTITVTTGGVLTVATTSGSTVSIDNTGKLTSTGTIQADTFIAISRFYSADGSQASPGISFSSDPDTGFYRTGSGAIGITTNNSLAGVIDTSTFTFYRILRNVDGSQASPGYSFYNDTDTGLYRSASGAIAISTNNSTAGVFDTGAFTCYRVMRNVDGSVGAPAYSFYNDTNTGIYRSGTDTFILAAGSQNIVTINTSGISLNSKSISSVSTLGVTTINATTVNATTVYGAVYQ